MSAYVWLRTGLIAGSAGIGTFILMACVSFVFGQSGKALPPSVPITTGLTAAIAAGATRVVLKKNQHFPPPDPTGKVFISTNSPERLKQLAEAWVTVDQADGDYLPEAEIESSNVDAILAGIRQDYQSQSQPPVVDQVEINNNPFPSFDEVDEERETELVDDLWS